MFNLRPTEIINKLSEETVTLTVKHLVIKTYGGVEV